uniref:cytokine receptor common subunit beta isoform X2 n=1 Tax=Semicossyphus pulcher TaxID=241346 RepID=UPI0037E8BF2D
MMPLLWVALWSALPYLALSSRPDGCVVRDSSSSQHESPLLRSLHCYNDYESYVHCRWKEHRRTGLQLWFKTDDDNNTLCEPYGEEEHNASEHRIVQCRYKTDVFSIAIKHTVFFLKKKTLCSSAPHEPLDLSQHLRARTPVNLSTHDAGDGGRQISWSSPYRSSSSLSKHIRYQLSYRTDRQDNWTTEDVTNTSIKLVKRLLIPGHRYEARVRARASVGQWSDWSPVETWKTEDDAGHFPSVHCVLDGEKEVMCTWEVSRETAHFITYQLASRHERTAQSVRCCVNLTVTSDPSGTVLKYSCRLTVADPEHLLLELQPTRNGKTFEAGKHIRPYPPQQVQVREKGSNWKVKWTAPSTASEMTLYYQVCYHRITEQRCSEYQNVSGSTALTILEADLVPLQRYRVKVRSLVDTAAGYEGIPSEWTDPVEWTSRGVFLTLYCTIPACHRRVVLWVDSVPSPGKSKILSEIKSATDRSFMQSENTFICKVQDLESLSTCSSVASLWRTKDSEEQDEGCWSCDKLHVPAEKVNSSDSSSMSFTGPYIFCQSSEPNRKSKDVKSKEKEEEKETPSLDSVAPSPVNFTLYGEGYVSLPGGNVSRSTQDLVCHSDSGTNTHKQESPDQDQQSPDTSPWSDKTDVQPGLSETSSSLQPPPYTSESFTSWPQGGAIQASGYCHIPSPHCGPVEFS